MAGIDSSFSAYVVSFSSYLEQEANRLTGLLELNDSQQNAVTKELTKLLVAFADKPVLTATDIAKAHLAAQHKLIELRQEFTEEHPIQVFHVKEGNKIAVLKPAPPISNLVFKGGGMKGQGYVPVLQTMESYGLTKNIKSVAGTSAGAITAAFMATGMSAASFAKLSAELDMDKQMDDAAPSEKRKVPSSPKTLKVDSGLIKDGQYGSDVELGKFKIFNKSVMKGKIKRSAEKLLLTFQKTLRENVQTHFDWKKLSGSSLPESAKKPLRDLLERLDSHPDYQITFGDLAHLHEFDPAHFKRLTLTGYNSTDKRLESFDAQTVPDMPIATAMRASMAIPKLIAPVKIMLRGEKKTIIDGAVGANVPSHLLNEYAHGGRQQDKGLDATGSVEARERAMAFAQTMVLTFDDDGAASSLLTSTPQEVSNAKPDIVSSAIEVSGINKNYFSQVVTPDNFRVYEAALRAFIVNAFGMTLANFDASKEEKQTAQLVADVRFTEQVRLNGLVDKDSAISLIFNSIKEACASLSDHELKAYVERKLGDQSGKSAEQLALEKKFGDAARKWIGQDAGQAAQNTSQASSSQTKQQQGVQ